MVHQIVFFDCCHSSTTELTAPGTRKGIHLERGCGITRAFDTRRGSRLVRCCGGASVFKLYDVSVVLKKSLPMFEEYD